MPQWQQGPAPAVGDGRFERVAAEATRRRRSREEAEGEILEAAAALLRDRPVHEVTVSAIMERTTLSRKSFYVYFRDRYELLARLFAPLRRELDQHNALFTSRPAGGLASPAAMHAVIGFMAGINGPLVRALHEASFYDAEARRVWREFNEPVIAAFTERIRREPGAVVPAGADVESMVRALVGMNLFCFFDRVVGRPDADLDKIATTLHAVWLRAFGLDA
jgi:AcrR family transcriptional regulator